MRTIVLVAMLLLPSLAVATPEEDAAGSMAIGDRLARLDTPIDLKAAILTYRHAIELDPKAERIALGKIEWAKERLRILAGPARERAAAAIAAHDDIEAERRLCEAIEIDPFDIELRVALGNTRSRLRREAVELQKVLFQLRGMNPGLTPGSLGVPPDAERFVNDPRFASPARKSHSG